MSAIEKLAVSENFDHDFETVSEPLLLSLDSLELSVSALARLRDHGLPIVDALLAKHTDEMLTDPKSLADVIHIDQYREGKKSPSEVHVIDVTDRSVHNIEISDRGESYQQDSRKIEAARKDQRLFEELCREHEGFLKFKVSNYFLSGGDRDDLMQEALFGFYKAVRDYDGLKSSFRSFADLCVSRQIMTAIKTANRFKHEPLNTYVSFERLIRSERGEEGDMTFEDLLPSRNAAVDEVVQGKESFSRIVDLIGTELTELEFNSLKFYLEGKSYLGMADILGVDTKAIDNALQRVKRKISTARAEEDSESPLISAGRR